jgi:hypothetical protein
MNSNPIRHIVGKIISKFQGKRWHNQLHPKCNGSSFKQFGTYNDDHNLHSNYT